VDKQLHGKGISLSALVSDRRLAVEAFLRLRVVPRNGDRDRATHNHGSLYEPPVLRKMGSQQSCKRYVLLLFHHTSDTRLQPRTRRISHEHSDLFGDEVGFTHHGVSKEPPPDLG
jgi:hypothetical protein